MVWALQRIEKEKPAAGKTDYWRDFWRSGWFNEFRVLFALGISVSAVVGDGSFGNGESPCAATDFGRADRY